MSSNILFQILLLCSIALSVTAYIPRFHAGRPRGGMLQSPDIEASELPADEWMEQTLDHFNDADTRTWQQRYFKNLTHSTSEGPIFIQIGGEGTANPIWMVTGHWMENAEKFGASCFLLEHRFYGKSHPTSDMSTENLSYLSSEQALADLADFIQFIRAKYGFSSKQKVFTFGGSYPGSLSAWMRYKYPHLVDGAVASSAPMYAVENFKEYMEVVRNSLATSGASCNTNIASAIAALQDKLASSDGRAEIKQKFMLCDDIDSTNDKDVSNLYSVLSGNFANVVQYNKDNRAFEGVPGTNITIDTLCAIMNDQSIASTLDRYAAVNSLMLKTYQSSCVEFIYSDMIKDMQQTSWNSSASEGGRQWFYQTCTEFGFYQTSDYPYQPFGNGFPLKWYVDQCADIYGFKFTESLLQHGINRTNTNYGGLALKVTKVIFPNGSIDPWHALGVTQDLSPSATAVFITGTAHCANMYPASADDLPALVKARETITQQLTGWM